MSSSNKAAGSILAVLLLAAMGAQTSTTRRVNINNFRSSRMTKIETSLDVVAVLDAMAKLSVFIKNNSADPSKFKMETGIREIELKMDYRVLVKAEKDFFNDSWSLQVCEELRDVLKPAPMF